MIDKAKKLILIGNGGHSKVIQDVIEANNLDIYAILDENTSKAEEKNKIIYSNLEHLEKIDIKEYYYFIAIGDNLTRKQLVEKLDIPKDCFIKLIHPSAIISESSYIGNGTVIMPNVVINANTKIGEQSIINTGSIIEHDNIIGNFVHISPNATITGNVKVGEGSHIGAGTTIIPGKKVGNWCKVGAGAVVTKDLPSNITAVGIPAKQI